MKTALFIILYFAMNSLARAQTYTNPIWHAPDPYSIQIDGFYYYTICNGVDQIYVFRSTTMLYYGESKMAYKFPEGQWNSKGNWGPAALFKWTDGRFYIYYTADDGDNINHRIGVLRAKTCDPLGEWEDLTPDAPINTGGCWAISMDPFQDLSGNWYVTWSGWRDQNFFPQVTYMAKMNSPTDIGQRVEISAPTEVWENSVAGIQEGQHVFRRNNKLFLFYSGNASWTDEYCVGVLTYEGGDILSPNSWKKSPQPLMQKTSQVFGPGGPAVVTSRDGSEYWMYYHCNDYSNSGWFKRSTNLIKLNFDANGYPINMDPIPWGVVTQGPTSNIPPSTPFNGTPAPVPGKIEAEDYNIGGEGISYHDLDNYNRGCSYRTDGVDIVGSYPNFIVYYFGADEWLDYSINASFTDSYKVSFYLACPFDNRTFNLYLDGNILASNLSIPNTGGWGNYQLVTHANIQIPQGNHVLRVKLNQEGVNWDYMQFESTSVSVFNITATAGAGGAITPSGPVAVSAGSNQSFTIAASLGYQISNVTVDGVATGAVSAFTFTNVTTHHTIAASFASTVVKLSGAIIGTPGSWVNSGNTISNVFDGDTGTYFDAPDPGTDTWAGLDLGAATNAVVTSISFFPRAGFEGRMSGCLFQGANDLEFNAPVDLYTIPATPPAGWSEVAITNPGSFRYLRYLSVGANYGNVAEVKFYGVVSTVPPGITRLSPTHGSMYGGTPVTITGTNLAGTSSVTFGDINAASMTVLNDTTVTCVTPAGAPGTVDVVLTAPGGSATNVNGFTYSATVYLTPPGDPNQGQTSFNAAGRWSDGQPPFAVNDYVVTNNATLRTPENSQNHTFAGNKLTLQGGGKLWHKGQSGTTVTLADLIVDNGEIRQLYPDALQYLAGAITVGSGGLKIDAQARNSELRIQAPISGPGAVTLLSTVASSAKIVLSATNTFTGATIVQGGTLAVQGQIAPNAANQGNAISVGSEASGAPATISIMDGAKILLPSSATKYCVVGNTGSKYGAVIQEGGEVVGAAPIRLAMNSSASVASYQLNGGRVSLTNSESYLQIGRDGRATFSQAGGTVTVARNRLGIVSGGVVIGHMATGVGTYDLTGGALSCTNSTASSDTLSDSSLGACIGFHGTGTLTVNGATASASFRGDVLVASRNGSTGTLNLLEGELRVNRLFRGEVNPFNGGTASFNFGGSSGSALLRPYDRDAAIGHATGANNIGITLTGSNAVLSSTDAFGAARTLTVYSAIGESGGPFGITLDGTGTSVLQSACTYGGPTVVQSGTLRMAGPNVLPPATELTVVSGATLDLISGVNTVRTFRVNGELQVRGKLYGAAQFTSGVTGSGTIFAVEGAGEKGMVLKIL